MCLRALVVAACLRSPAAGRTSVDCPHRERLGYLGDAHTTLETALQTTEAGPFFTKWLRDMADIQGMLLS